MIHCDHKPRSIYDHLSEEAIDRHCIDGSTGSVSDDTHLSTCLRCTQQALEVRQFLRILDRAVEAIMTGRAKSSTPSRQVNF